MLEKKYTQHALHSKERLLNGLHRNAFHHCLQNKVANCLAFIVVPPSSGLVHNDLCCESVCVECRTYIHPTFLFVLWAFLWWVSEECYCYCHDQQGFSFFWHFTFQMLKKYQLVPATLWFPKSKYCRQSPYDGRWLFRFLILYRFMTLAPIQR